MKRIALLVAIGCGSASAGPFDWLFRPSDLDSCKAEIASKPPSRGAVGLAIVACDDIYQHSATGNAKARAWCILDGIVGVTGDTGAGVLNQSCWSQYPEDASDAQVKASRAWAGLPGCPLLAEDGRYTHRQDPVGGECVRLHAQQARDDRSWTPTGSDPCRPQQEPPFDLQSAVMICGPTEGFGSLADFENGAPVEIGPRGNVINALRGCTKSCRMDRPPSQY